MSVAGNPGSSNAIHLKTGMDPASPDPARRPISQIDIALSEGVTRKFSLCQRGAQAVEMDIDPPELPAVEPRTRGLMDAIVRSSPKIAAKPGPAR